MRSKGRLLKWKEHGFPGGQWLGLCTSRAASSGFLGFLLWSCWVLVTETGSRALASVVAACEFSPSKARSGMESMLPALTGGFFTTRQIREVPGGSGLIPGQRTRIPHSAQLGHLKKKKKGRIRNIYNEEKNSDNHVPSLLTCF